MLELVVGTWQRGENMNERQIIPSLHERSIEFAADGRAQARRLRADR
jgi:hypothetical protein